MKKSTITLAIGVLCISLSIAQSFPYERTQLREKHQLITGTNLWLIPPADFHSSTNFKGFQRAKDSISMIMVLEVPCAFVEISNGFTKEMLAQKGMKLLTRKTVEIEGFDGLQVEIEQKMADFLLRKTILLYGNTKASILINGVYRKEAVQLGRQIRESIQSLKIDHEIAVDARQHLSYEVDESKGNLVWNSVIGNSIIFTRDGKVPTQSTDKVTLIIDKSLSKGEIPNKKQFCLHRLARYTAPLRAQKNRAIEWIELDGLTGYGIYAENPSLPEEEIYQLILFEEGGGYYLLTASYLKIRNQSRKDIQEVIHSFKRKCH